jgi:SM-20-related protein
MSAAASPLALNPNLDIDALRLRFSRGGRIQIPDFLTPASSEILRRDLLADARWRRVIKGGDKVFEIPAADFQRMPAAERQPIDAAIEAEAARGFQFRYEAIRVPDAPSARAGLDGSLIAFAALMGSAPVLDLLGAITGIGPLAFADAQATVYRPGDFLNRHDDDVAGKNRKLAYVLGLAPDWRPDWGGLLMFEDGQGGIVETIVPRFNALSLFSVPQPHSVSCVAPFAPEPRLSITGWIRSELPQA